MTTDAPRPSPLEPRDRDGAAWAAAGFLAVAAVALPLGLALGVGGLRRLADAGFSAGLALVVSAVLLAVAVALHRFRDRVPGVVLTAVPPLTVLAVVVLRLGAGEAGAALRVVALAAVVLAALHLRAPVAWATLALAVVGDAVVSLAAGRAATGSLGMALLATAVLGAVGAVLVVALVRAADALEAARSRLAVVLGAGPVAPAPAAPADEADPPAVADLAELAALGGVAPADAAPGGSWGTGLVAAEIDLLSEVVAAHGDDARDALLRHTARVLRDGVRPGDTVVRLRGEELVVLFPGVSASAVQERAESLRRSVRDTPMAWRGGTLHATVSVGAAHVPPGPTDLAELHAEALAALRRAREEERVLGASG